MQKREVPQPVLARRFCEHVFACSRCGGLGEGIGGLCPIGGFMLQLASAPEEEEEEELVFVRTIDDIVERVLRRHGQ